MRVNGIVVIPAGRERGSGRGGRRSNDTGKRQRGNGSARGKTGATGSASRAGKRQKQGQFSRVRGSSLGNIFFDYGCDRPGCYERFAQRRRSPLQRFCCAGCRRALERVRERERRWKQARI